MSSIWRSVLPFVLTPGFLGCSAVVVDDKLGEGGSGGLGAPDDGDSTTTAHGSVYDAISTATSDASSTATGCPPPIGDCDMFACPGYAPPSLVVGQCHVECVCPPACTTHDECPADQFCRFYDQECGAKSQGVGACAPRDGCIADGPVCGCDGQSYASACDAWAAGQSTTLAPGNDCSAERVPCTDDPAGVSCYAANEWCQIVEGIASCQRFGYTVEPCEDLACGCLDQVYDATAYTCSCGVLPSGLHVVTCQ